MIKIKKHSRDTMEDVSTFLQHLRPILAVLLYDIQQMKLFQQLITCTAVALRTGCHGMAFSDQEEFFSRALINSMKKCYCIQLTDSAQKITYSSLLETNTLAQLLTSVSVSELIDDSLLTRSYKQTLK